LTLTGVRAAACRNSETALVDEFGGVVGVLSLGMELGCRLIDFCR